MNQQIVSVNAINAANSPQGFQPIRPIVPQSLATMSFPVGALPSVLADYVKSLAEHTQTAVDMAGVISLGVLAVCLQGKYVVEGTPGYTEPLSLYVLPVASPEERKSGVMRPLFAPVYAYEQQYNEAHAAEIRQNKLEREDLEQRIAILKNQQANKADWGNSSNCKS